ncbi:unnamed protein product [Closterium sp. NIES-53]
MALVSSEVPRDDAIRSGPIPSSAGRGEHISAFPPSAEQQNCHHAVPRLALISPHQQRLLPPSSGAHGAIAESGQRFRCSGLEHCFESSASRRGGEKESAMMAAKNPRNSSACVSASEATQRAAEIERDTPEISPAEARASPVSAEETHEHRSARREESSEDRRQNLAGAHKFASGDQCGGSETISEREQLFLQELHRSSLESRQRILTNAADVWISHLESDMWLGQLESLASAQQENDNGQHQHATWRTGGLYRFGSGTFRKPRVVVEKHEQTHQPRGERRLKRSGESSKSTQRETFAQQRHQQQQTPPLAVEEPRGSTPAAPAARGFSRARSASGGSDTGGRSGGIFFPRSGGFSRTSTAFSGGGGGSIVVPRSPSRASWLFGSTTRSAQERSTSRLSADGSA